MPEASAQSESRIDYREIPKQSGKAEKKPHRAAFQCSHISKQGWVPQYRRCKACAKSSRVRRIAGRDNNASTLALPFFYRLSCIGLSACAPFALATYVFSVTFNRVHACLLHRGDRHACIDVCNLIRIVASLESTMESTMLDRARHNSRARIAGQRANRARNAVLMRTTRIAPWGCCIGHKMRVCAAGDFCAS